MVVGTVVVVGGGVVVGCVVVVGVGVVVGSAVVVGRAVVIGAEVVSGALVTTDSELKAGSVESAVNSCNPFFCVFEQDVMLSAIDVAKIINISFFIIFTCHFRYFCPFKGIYVIIRLGK